MIKGIVVSLATYPIFLVSLFFTENEVNFICLPPTYGNRNRDINNGENTVRSIDFDQAGRITWKLPTSLRSGFITLNVSELLIYK